MDLPLMFNEKARSRYDLPGCVPVSFAFEECGGALALDFSQVLQVRDAVARLKNFQLFASREVIALPAAFQPFLSRAASYLTLWRATITPAGFLAAQLHHRAQQVIAVIVVLELLEDRHLGHHIGHFAESVAPQLLSQVSGQIGHGLCIAGTIATMQSAIADQILLLGHGTFLPNHRCH